MPIKRVYKNISTKEKLNGFIIDSTNVTKKAKERANIIMDNLIEKTAGNKQSGIAGLRANVRTSTALLTSMVGAMSVERSSYKHGNLFAKDYRIERVVNSTLASGFFPEGRANIRISLKGAVGQMVSTTLNLRYPIINIDNEKDVIEVTSRFGQDVLNKKFVQKGLMDDELYTMILGITKQFKIYYNKKTLSTGMVPKSSVVRKSLDLEILESGDQQAIDRLNLLNFKSDLKTSQEKRDIGLKLLLAQEVKAGYTSEVFGDKGRDYAYTHILRRNLKLTLQTWQIDFLTSWKQYNILAASRRLGKTFMSAYIAYRDLYKLGSGYGDRKRQILYVTLNDNKAWQPFQYLMGMTERDRELGYIVVNLQRKEFTCTLTGTKLIFITAGARGGAASYGADLVIIDEAAMIPNDFWDDLLPIIVQERATVFAISTINESSKQNWFYKYLLNGELGTDKLINSARYTIDDNEILANEDKERLKSELSDNQLKYWTQLYSIFPSGSTIFNLNGVVRTVHNPTNRDTVVIGYDPAKLGDNAALVVIDPTTFEVVEEYTTKGVSYIEQKHNLEMLKKKYHKSIVIMDRSGVGEAVYEIFGDLIDYGVKYKAGGNITIDPVYGYYKVSKGELVDTLRMYFEEYSLVISDQLNNLIKELKGFKVIQDKGAILKYGGVGVTDDSVNALALCVFCMKHIIGISHPIDTSELNEVSATIEVLPDGSVIDHRGNPFGTSYVEDNMFSDFSDNRQDFYYNK